MCIPGAGTLEQLCEKQTHGRRLRGEVSYLSVDLRFMAAERCCVALKQHRGMMLASDLVADPPEDHYLLIADV